MSELGRPAGETPPRLHPAPNTEAEYWRKDAHDLRRYGASHDYVSRSRFLQELGLREFYRHPLPPFFKSYETPEYAGVRQAIPLVYTYRTVTRRSPDLWRFQVYLVNYVRNPLQDWYYAGALPLGQQLEVTPQMYGLLSENDEQGIILERMAYSRGEEIAAHLKEWDPLPIP